MSDDGNRTEKGLAPAPFGTEDTMAAPTEAPSAPPGDSAPGASRTLPTLDRDRYQMIGEVGRGGLGRILRARDRNLDRNVAVKELLDPDASAQARFVREALITARLQHPAIVPIYDAGQSGDKGPFYAMKLVAGESLAESLRGKRTLAERLVFLPSVIAVVDAVAYAHSEKIVHRDLKPQNVLVGKYGETVLIDWGLAKDLSAAEQSQRGPYRAASLSPDETVDGAVIGTPAFMPPEQAAGEEVDERADVYSLGAMLYFVIAGVAPHRGRSMDDMLSKIVEGDIIPVDEREPRCPADLAAIVAKAMARRRADRYPTAQELAIDLKKFQTGQLVGAHQYTIGDRFKRWLKRHRAIVSVSAVALVILIGYGVWSIQQMRERKEEALAAAELARENAAEATKQRDIVITQSMLVRARQYAVTGHTAEEIAVLRALAHAGEEGRRLAVEEGGLIWKGHQRLAMGLGHDVGLVFRTTDNAHFLASEPGALVTWDANTGRELSRMTIEGDTARFGRILAISPHGKFVLLRECAAADRCGIDIRDNGNVYVPKAGTEFRLMSGTTVVQTWSEGVPLDRRHLAFDRDDVAAALIEGDRVRVLGGESFEVKGCTGPLALASAKQFAIGCKDHVLLHTEQKQVDILRGKPPEQLVFVSPERLLAIGESLQLYDVTRGELRGEGRLQAAREDEEDESEDVPWAYYPPGWTKGAAETATAQIRVSHSASIVPRTSILWPPARQFGTNGALVSLEGHDWQSLALGDDIARYALVDQLVPAEPPDRCLPRVGGERHAVTSLDRGERILVDQQELPVGLDLAPPEGYRHTTTLEAPVRQLRPLVAAETAACLVWGDSLGAHTKSTELEPFVGAVSDGHGGVVIASVRTAFRIDKDGARIKIATAAGTPLISYDGAYVATVDATTHTLVISETTTGAAVRTWTGAGSTDVEWIAKGIVHTMGHVISVDPKIAPRAYASDLVVDPRSPFGTIAVNGKISMRDVATDKEVLGIQARVDRAYVTPDANQSMILETGDKRRLVTADTAVELAALKADIIGFDIASGLLVAHQKARSDAWDLKTGALLDIPASANLFAVTDDTLWMLDGPRKITLVKISRKTGAREQRELLTAGAPLHHIADEIAITGKRLVARYAVTEELFAYGIWDIETGALLWVGPQTASVIDDWIISGGAAYLPVFGIDEVLADTGRRTNLRVCEKDLRVVPVEPPPAPDTYWAPPSACH